MCSIFRLFAENFAFDTEIHFKVIGESFTTEHLKIKEIKLNLSIKSLNVSKQINKFREDFLFLSPSLLQSLQLTVISLHIKF